jgi:hypothetical protein
VAVLHPVREAVLRSVYIAVLHQVRVAVLHPVRISSGLPPLLTIAFRDFSVSLGDHQHSTFE